MEKDRLEEAVKDRLEDKGVLERIRAELRKEVVKALKEGNKEKKGKQRNSQQTAMMQSPENVLINGMILEYLRWNGMGITADTMLEEGNAIKETVMSRKETEQELNITCGENAATLPLIYSLVATVKDARRK